MRKINGQRDQMISPFQNRILDMFFLARPFSLANLNALGIFLLGTACTPTAQGGKHGQSGETP